MSVAPWTLRDSESDLSRLTAAQDFEGHALSHGAAFQGELDIVGILHLPAAESDQDIADDHAGLGGGSLGFQREHDQTFMTIGKHDGLQSDAEIAAGNVPARQDFVNHAIQGHRWDGESGDAGERAGGDPDSFAVGVDDGAAVRPRVDGEIEAEVMVEPSAAPGAPFAARRADDAESSVGAGILDR